MNTLKQKIKGVEDELTMVRGKVIPDLQENVRLLTIAYKGEEVEEEEGVLLGNLETAEYELAVEKNNVLALQRQLTRLKSYVKPSRRVRKPCGRC